MEHVAIVNIYNFIRKTVYPSGQFVKEELETVLYEIEETKRYGFSATYALKYDALMDENYVALLKDNLDEFDEIACWWEIDESLASKASVKWKGETPVDDHVNKGYSLAYTKEERIKMVDVYMEDFKSIFGYYPKTVGSWVIDIVTLKHFKDKYQIEGAAICRDQIGTDGFTLSGGYYNQAYYPSLFNEFMPAQTKEHQLDLPIFRLLGADPIYAFEDGIRKSVCGVYTLEPAATIAQNRDWVEWFFQRQVMESTIGFSYVQTGQENTFLWDTMSKGYELQMKHLAEIEEPYQLRIQTLAESAAWYKRKYQLTPVTTYAATKDWNTEENLKTLWYNSRFYRLSFLFENGSLIIRDLHLFNENYRSRYYEDVLTEEESIFDTLPVVDGHQFSTDDVRAKIQFFELKSQGLLTELEGNPIRFEKLNDCDYRITWLLNNGISVLITCEENKLQIKTNQAFEHSRILLAMKYCPVLKVIKNNVFNFTHEQFDYSLFVDQGEILNLADFDLAIASENEGLEMRFSEQQSLVSQAFLNSNMIEDYTPRNKQNHFMKRAFKPVIDPKVSLTGIYESEVFRIKNPNNEGQIYYTLDGTPPTKQSLLYQKPIVLTQEGQIRAKIFVDGMKESVEEDAGYFQSQPIKKIKGQTLPVEIKKYNPNGVEMLIDGKKGTKDYRDGAWLGYHDDLDVVVDLEKATQFNQITVGFLQDTRAWIYYPKDVLVEGSLDGINFEIIEMINCDESIERKEIAVTNIQVQKAMNYRYIRVFAKNQRVCPPWSILPGEGPTFLFVDQISIL